MIWKRIEDILQTMRWWQVNEGFGQSSAFLFRRSHVEHVVPFTSGASAQHTRATQDVAENRAEYRSMCFATPGLSEHIGGVILHWETLFQKDAGGKAIVDIIKDNGMIPGIKVDKGYNKKLGLVDFLFFLNFLNWLSK